MTFPRELILEQLVTIAKAVPGVTTVARDAIHFDDAQLPAISILEGDEEADEKDPINRPPNTVRRIYMTPHILIRASGTPDNLAPNINIFYAAMVKAVMTDTTLPTLCLDGGRGIRFLGMESDLSLGRSMMGHMAVKFQFTYGLTPDSL